MERPFALLLIQVTEVGPMQWYSMLTDPLWHQHPMWTMVRIPALPFPIKFPASGLGTGLRVGKNGPTPLAPVPTWKTQKKTSRGTSLAQT